MKNYEYCKYTYLHRQALKFYITTNKCLNKEDKLELIDRMNTHDMDKLVLYTIISKKAASKFHRKNNSHHLKNNIKKTRIDYLEAIFDWECAAVTKPDKPLNAYDTLITYYSEYTDEILPLLKELHMDSSYYAVTSEALSYINSIDVNQDTIYAEITNYLLNISTEQRKILLNKIFIENGTLLSYYDIYKDDIIDFITSIAVDEQHYPVKDYIKNKDYSCYLHGKNNFIFLKNEKIIATCGLIKVNENTAKLNCFYIDKDYRNLGLGTRLYKEQEEFAKNIGYEKIILCTHEDNPISIKFYTKLGFEIYKKEEDKEIWMEKNI